MILLPLHRLYCEKILPDYMRNLTVVLLRSDGFGQGIQSIL
jgi:hypothetical protein